MSNAVLEQVREALKSAAEAAVRAARPKSEVG